MKYWVGNLSCVRRDNKGRLYGYCVKCIVDGEVKVVRRFKEATRKDGLVGAYNAAVEYANQMNAEYYARPKEKELV